MDINLIAACLRAAQRREAADALGRLAGHYHSDGRARSTSADDRRAFSKRVARRRAKTGYR